MVSSPLVTHESEVPDCFGMSKCVILNWFWDSLPVKNPHVSIFELVFDCAIDKNLAISMFGTVTCRSPPDPEYSDILDGLEDLSGITGADAVDFGFVDLSGGA